MRGFASLRKKKDHKVNVDLLPLVCS